MTKTNIALGSEIKYGHLTCVVLEDFEDSLLVLSKDSIGEMPFDEDGHNNFNKSSLRSYLNNDFLEELEANGADINALCELTIDLTSDDGLKDYGNSTNKVNLLTCDMYRKYRHLIPNHNDWWWLATAYSTNYWYADIARIVSSDGSRHYYYACYGHIGVRPAFLLKSSIFESLNQDLFSLKPVPLFEYLIRTCTNEGETVLDNCMGSGTTAIACINTNRNYIGFELDADYYEASKQRLESHMAQIQITDLKPIINPEQITFTEDLTL